MKANGWDSNNIMQSCSNSLCTRKAARSEAEGFAPQRLLKIELCNEKLLQQLISRKTLKNSQTNNLIGKIPINYAFKSDLKGVTSKSSNSSKI